MSASWKKRTERNQHMKNKSSIIFLVLLLLISAVTLISCGTSNEDIPESRFTIPTTEEKSSASAENSESMSTSEISSISESVESTESMESTESTESSSFDFSERTTDTASSCTINTPMLTDSGDTATTKSDETVLPVTTSSESFESRTTATTSKFGGEKSPGELLEED